MYTDDRVHIHSAIVLNLKEIGNKAKHGHRKESRDDHSKWSKGDRERQISYDITSAAATLLRSCPTVRPHRRQPTSLPHPWDSPGKNTGVGRHFLFQYMKVKSQSEVAQLCPALSSPMDSSLLGSSVHGIFQARLLEWGAIASRCKLKDGYKWTSCLEIQPHRLRK